MFYFLAVLTTCSRFAVPDPSGKVFPKRGSLGVSSSSYCRYRRANKNELIIITRGEMKTGQALHQSSYCPLIVFIFFLALIFPPTSAKFVVVLRDRPATNTIFARSDSSTSYARHS